ncbi:MAG: hypothetical protein M1495_01525 [Bacteroidetes bacterium]|nr:hypothetical protein [Bacteroidota bacterium]
MNHLEDLLANREVFFNFMKEKYPLFYNSNIFFRDIQYAIISYYQKKDTNIKRQAAEIIAKNFVTELEKSGELKRMSNNSWKVNFSFQKSVTEIKTDSSVSV